MSLAAYLSWSALAVFVYMTGLFAVALARKDNSFADVGWGLGFVIVALLTLILEPGATPRSVLVTGLVTVWGARLALHIFIRNRGRGEDFRYAKWRRDWGRGFIVRSYLQVFLLQGVFMVLIAFPVVLVNRSAGSSLTVWDGLGLAVWAVGFYFEAVADAQLLRFKRDPLNKGKIMTSGLWSLSRHPNYFGEATQWWGLFIIVLAVPRGWTAVVSPITITFLLLRVSGVTLLEKKYEKNPKFAAYARRTSAFLPRKPRKL
jgi:steroid 5-alpha reductase family enzyme